MSADRLGPAAALVAALLVGGCASNTAPPGWLPTPAEAAGDGYGGWIDVTWHDGRHDSRTDGELIAVNSDSVWILGQDGRRIIPTTAVQRGKLTAYDAKTGGLAIWTLLGTLSTISNGFYLLATAPTWIIGGSLATGSQSRAPVRSHPPRSWAELAAFARFPAGLPGAVDFQHLRAK